MLISLKLPPVRTNISQSLGEGEGRPVVLPRDPGWTPRTKDTGPQSINHGGAHQQSPVSQGPVAASPAPPRPRGDPQHVLRWFSNNGTQLATGFRVKKDLTLNPSSFTESGMAVGNLLTYLYLSFLLCSLAFPCLSICHSGWGGGGERRGDSDK